MAEERYKRAPLINGEDDVETPADLVKRLTDERERLKKRGDEINALMPGLAKNDPIRANLVGEKTGIDQRLKQINPELAQAQREANGTALPSPKRQRPPIPDPIALADAAGLTKRDVAAIVAMAVLVHKANGWAKAEEDAKDIAEAAWEIADEMFMKVPPDEPLDDPEGDES